MKISRKSFKIAFGAAFLATFLSSCSRGYGCPYEFSVLVNIIHEAGDILISLKNIF
ncbi:MAG: hypothetical protein WBB26_12710 [Saprospiraceae bacterium]|nr:hypothetical protein [Saprospiraceae bacterium]